MESIAVSPQPFSPQLPPTHRLRYLVIAALALGVIASCVSLWLLFAPSAIVTSKLENKAVELVQGNVPSWQTFSLNKLEEQASAPGFEKASVQVLEAVSFGTGGDTAVLARQSGISGIALGILHSDQSFTPVLADGADKSHLSVNGEGTAAFSETLTPPARGADSPQPAPGQSKVMSISLSKGAPSLHDYGVGATPHFLPDGSLLMVAREGIVSVSPAGARSVLLPYTQGASNLGIISNDGTLAALPFSTGIRVYRLTPGQNTFATMITSLFDPTHAPLLGFVGSDYLITTGGSGAVTLYPIASPGTAALVKIQSTIK